MEHRCESTFFHSREKGTELFSETERNVGFYLGWILVFRKSVDKNSIEKSQFEAVVLEYVHWSSKPLVFQLFFSPLNTLIPSKLSFFWFRFCKWSINRKVSITHIKDKMERSNGTKIRRAHSKHLRVYSFATACFPAFTPCNVWNTHRTAQMELLRLLRSPWPWPYRAPSPKVIITLNLVGFFHQWLLFRGYLFRILWPKSLFLPCKK